MSIQQHIIVRHRALGHLRFQLPALLCTPSCAECLVAGLLNVAGIYRVDYDCRRARLSIRYQHTVCEERDVARRLHTLVAELPATLTRTEATPHAAMATAPVWLQEKAEELRETLTALGIVVRQLGKGVGGVVSNGNWLNEFLNDLLMLYLIKMHWQSITQLWLLNPWRYRYEWSATFYLIYLHVKSKLPKPG